MWPAALITAGAAAFGRLFAVGILPSALFVTTIWLLVRADAFSPKTRGLQLGEILPGDFEAVKGGSILLFLLVVAVLTAVMQSFQIGIVRILEGYWGSSSIAAVLFTAGVRRHSRRRRRAQAILKLDDDARRMLSDEGSSSKVMRLPDQAAVHRATVRSQLRSQRARLLVEAYPPGELDLLPTGLGNALRSGERRAGERYGWSTVHAWPRLYFGLSEPIAVAYRSARDAVDAAAVFCLVFLIVALLTIGGFYDDPGLWWLPTGFLILSGICYRAAVTAAITQGVIQQSAFDRGRFELLEAMHEKLPDTPEEEYKTARAVSEFLAHGIDPEDAIAYLRGRRYSHADSERLKWLPRLGRGRRSAQ